MHHAKKNSFPAKSPSEKDVRDYLNGLNRTERAAIVSCDTPRLKAAAIANYQKWFKHYRIAVYQDEKSLEWKLGSSLPSLLSGLGSEEADDNER